MFTLDDCKLFVLHASLSADALYLTCGKVKKNGSIRNSKVYLLEETDSVYDGSVDAITARNGVILVFADHLERRVCLLVSEKGLFNYIESEYGIAIGTEERNKIAFMMGQATIDYDTLLAMVNDFAMAHGVDEKLARFILYMVRLSYLLHNCHEEKFRQGRVAVTTKALRNEYFSAIIHETVHAETAGVVGEEDTETFSRLAELGVWKVTIYVAVIHL